MTARRGDEAAALTETEVAASEAMTETAAVAESAAVTETASDVTADDTADEAAAEAPAEAAAAPALLPVTGGGYLCDILACAFPGDGHLAGCSLSEAVCCANSTSTSDFANYSTR